MTHSLTALCCFQILFDFNCLKPCFQLLSSGSTYNKVLEVLWNFEQSKFQPWIQFLERALLEQLQSLKQCLGTTGLTGILWSFVLKLFESFRTIDPPTGEIFYYLVVKHPTEPLVFPIGQSVTLFFLKSVILFYKLFFDCWLENSKSPYYFSKYLNNCSSNNRTVQTMD